MRFHGSGFRIYWRRRRVFVCGCCSESPSHPRTQTERPRPLPQKEPPDRLLTVEEVAGLLAVPPRWIYDHADKLPFTRRIGPRTLRFSEPGLLRWLESRR
ncbi:MAG: helix-turn-helix domain-containing protein [Gemmatimonadetes bacterium]|nr:helix-turn-helix domain-containing protein [Gemmatimonadota bacterium]